MPGPLPFVFLAVCFGAIGFVAGLLTGRPQLLDRLARFLEGPQHKWRADTVRPIAPRVVPPRHLRVVHHPYDWREEGA